MSYSEPQYGEEPYVGYRKVRARKEWPCAYGKTASRGEGREVCDGTIRPGDTYIDETLAPWTPEYDETGEDGYGRPTFGQVGVLGQWQHTRYHEECDRLVVEHQQGGTPAERAAEQAFLDKEHADAVAADKRWQRELAAPATEGAAQ